MQANKRFWSGLIALSVLLSLSLWLTLRSAQTKSDAPALQGAAALEHLKQQGQYDSLARVMEATRYQVRATQVDGRYAAANPAQGFHTTFSAEGIELAAPGGRDWHLPLRLRGIGYGQQLHGVSAATVQANGQRAELHRTIKGMKEEGGARNEEGGRMKDENGTPASSFSPQPSSLIEWYENRPAGLEQGFTVNAAPGTRHAGERLALALTVGAGWRALVQPGGLAAALTHAASGTQLQYDKLVVTDATGRRLPATVTTAGTAMGAELRLEVADAGAQYPLTIDPTFSQQAYLKASNTEASDFFGFTVALSGNTLVVGAIGEDSAATSVDGDQADNSAGFSGAAYVFVRNGMTWSQQAYLKASNAAEDDRFGRSVAISGDTIVVGANGEDSNATGVNGDQTNNSSGTAGAAYVFVRNGTTWSQQAYLKASNTGASDNFGWSVAVDGNTLVVGATGEDSNATGVDGDQTNNSASTSGAAYVFVRNGTTWAQQAYLKASNTGAGDEFGFSLALDGDTILVAAYLEDSNATGVDGDQTNNSFGSAGAAYVFVRNGTTWSQQAYLKASNTGANDNLGESVSISGNTIVVGADGEDSNATGVNGDQTNNSVNNAGAAYVFVRNGTTWAQQAYLKASNPGDQDSFGQTVAVDGDTIVIGAINESSDATGVDGDQANDNANGAGAAYVFTRSGTDWAQSAYLKASNTGAGDGFGGRVAVDGSTIVVRAFNEDSNATGINGDQADNSAENSGAVYVFTAPPPTPPPANGPVCTTYTSRTTANGLASDFLTSVYVEGSTVYAGSSSALSISTDGGMSFTNRTTANGLGSNIVRDVFAVGSTVYAATFSGLSISTNGGANFVNKTTANGLGNNSATAVYAVGSMVYAGTQGGLSISTDGGSSFTNKTTANGLGGNNVNGVYAVGSTVYVATNGGLSISTDGGNNFTNRTTTNGLGSNNVRDVYAVGSTVYATLAVGEGGAVSISADGGNTFTNKTTADGLGAGSLGDVYAVGSTVYVATQDGLSISTNGGASFTNYSSAGFGVNDVFATSSTIYVATLDGLKYCSASVAAPDINVKGNNTTIASGDTTPATADGTDFGSAAANTGANANYFTIENTGSAALNLTGTPKVALSGANASDFSIALQPASPVAATNGTTTFLVNFAPTATGLRTATISIASDDPDENPYTFTIQGTGTAALANGSTCTNFTNRTTANGLGDNISNVVYAAGNTVYVANAGGVSISTDGGNSYTNRTTANGLGSNNVRGLYVVGNTVYAATDGGLSISTDGGATFSNKTTADGLGNNLVFSVYVAGNTVYAGTSGGLSISTNGGSSFTNRTTADGLGNNVVYGVYALGSAVYAATNGGLAISTDGGVSFSNKTTANGLGNNTVRNVYVVGNTVYVATTGGLSISTNGGGSFNNKTTTDGLGDNTVWNVFVAGSTVYAATFGGLSVSTNGGGSFANYTQSSGLGDIYVYGVFATANKIYVANEGGVSFCPPPPPSINIKGNNTTIASGDTSPSTTDGTNFGSVPFGSGPVAKTFTIENLGVGTLNLTGTPLIALSGPNAADFSVTTLPTTPVAANATTSFTITFNPGSGGIKNATVTIANNDPNKGSYNFAIQAFTCVSDPVVTTTADSGTGSLREAIANACPGATITFASPLFDAAQTITLTSGDLIITRNLIITGPGADKLTVFGNNQSRVFTVNLPDNNTTVTISGLTVTGGNGVSSLASRNGDGGGILLNLGNLTLLNSIVRANTATSTLGSNGGGITNRGDGSSALTLTNCIITGNDTNRSGGGIFNLGGPMTVSNSTISNNRAGLQSDSSGLGGGIENYYPMTLTNSTISGNSVANTFGSHGGGLYTPAGSDDGSTTLLQIISCTITGNTAAGTNSAGGLRLDYKNNAPLTVSNTIIAGNTGNSGATADVNSTGSGGAFTSGGYNLIGDGTGATGFSGTGDQVGTSGSPILVGLGPLADNGGPTFTHALLSGSPAIDKGKAFDLTTDQRGTGFSRTVDNPSTLNANGGDGTDIGAFEIQCSAPTIATAPQPQTVCEAGNASFSVVAGGTGPFSYQWKRGATNVGTNSPMLMLSNVTANDAGLYTVVIAGACGMIETQAVQLTVNAATAITTPPQPQAVNAGQTATFSVVASGTGPFSYQWKKGAVNVGMDNPTLQLNNVTTADNGNYTVTVTGTCGNVTSQPVALTVNALPTIVAQAVSPGAGSTALPVPIATVNDAETPAGSLGVKINNSSSASSNGVTVSNLVNTNGVITAQVAIECSATTAQFTLQVTDANGQTATTSLTVTVAPNPAPVLSYNAQSFAPGATPSFGPAGASDNGTIMNYALQSITPANGLSLSINSSNGQVTVTGATVAQSYTVVIVATDNCGATTPATFPVTVPCPTITFSPASLPGAAVNAAYNQSLTALPAGGNYSFAVTSGLLPQGLTLNPNGSFSGAPSQSGTFNFRVTATGFGGCSAFYDYVLNVACAGVSITTNSLPGGGIGTPYNQTIAVSPAATYSFAVTSGALPPGLTLNAGTGAINGTPTTGGSFNFTVTASQGGCSSSQSYTVTIGCAAITLSPASPLPNGQAGVAYSQTISVSAAGSYTFSLSLGSLPSGLTLNPTTGLLGGTPTVTGKYSFTIQALAGSGCTASQSYALIIVCPTVTLSPATLPNASTGTAYSQTLSVAPAGGNYTFAVTTGSLPTGLNLNSSTGVITGTPTVANSFTFRVTATGFGGCTGFRDYTIVVGNGACPTITLPATLPNGTIGSLYNQGITASPAGTYSYAVTSGAVPPGTALYTSIGLLFGYPTAAGSYTFTVTATQGACTASKTYTVQISAGFASALSVASDFDGDLKSDLSVFRADGNWEVSASRDGKTETTLWGAPYAPYYDLVVSGDYDGDGKTDPAVFRRGTEYAGYWFIKKSSDGELKYYFWGLPTDVPTPGDYDGDGKTDAAVWRASEGIWYFIRSSDNGIRAIHWGSGALDDVAVPGDYDGDGKTDAAVFRKSNGHWYVKRSSDDKTLDVHWGVGTDVPVPGDYDGDAKTDYAVWRASEGIWYWVESGSAAVKTVTLGAAGDVPVPTDYDGDGKADAAIWQAATGNWQIVRSSDGKTVGNTYGRSGDTPVPARRN